MVSRLVDMASSVRVLDQGSGNTCGHNNKPVYGHICHIHFLTKTIVSYNFVEGNTSVNSVNYHLYCGNNITAVCG